MYFPVLLKRKQQGLSMIEVILAMGFLMISMLSLGMLIQISVKEKQQLIQKTQVLLEAKSLALLLPILSRPQQQQYLEHHHKSTITASRIFSWDYHAHTQALQVHLFLPGQGGLLLIVE